MRLGADLSNIVIADRDELAFSAACSTQTALQALRAQYSRYGDGHRRDDRSRRVLTSASTGSKQAEEEQLRTHGTNMSGNPGL